MNRGIFGWVVFILFALMLAMLLMQRMERRQVITMNDFWRYVENDSIQSLTIQDNSLKGKLKPEAVKGLDEPREFELKYPPGAIDSTLVNWIRERCRSIGKVDYDETGTMFFTLLIQLVPWVLIFAFIWFFVFRQFRGAGGGAGMLGNFGRSRHRISTREHTHITFADVAGVDEAKEEVAEIIEFLKNPKRFQRLGGRIPRGVLLVGEPGCGKTLLAKAIAGEADVPFFSISGSDFVEMFVGVGASRVRDLFKQAKDNSPCIIFLDEIDAVGRRRGAGYNGGGHDEREQTLNAILVEMDGFDTSDQVIVVAATNRVDVLDPALIRPGRFDRQVYVPLPDVKGRLEILKVHAKKIKLGPDVDLHRLARGTPMFSGADLAAIINEAALLATMANKDWVEMSDLEEARDKVRWGRAKKSREVDEKEKRVVAYHEAGHALVQALTPDADPIHKVSIIPRGQAGGATFSLPEKDRMVYGRKFLTAMMKVAFGGRIAEEMFCDDISSGASSDIRQVTEIVRRMVIEWGMSDKVGFVYHGEEGRTAHLLGLPGGREYSEQTAQMIDAEIKRLVDTAFEETRRLMEANRDKLDAIAKALLKYETLDGQDVHRLIRGEPLDRPSVADLLDAEGTATRRAPEPPRAKPIIAKPELGP
ncbi:MAG: ATP-dependent zinc metalloprotease FtsH, partial [Phycisphaerae bacterium]